MERLVNTLRKNMGYISIETVIVAGLIIGLGALSISAFQTSANGVTSKALTEVNNIQTNYQNLQGPQG